MTTYVDLKTIVSRLIRDEGRTTFDVTDVGDFINAGLAEVGRIAPERFQEDITPVADTLSYILRTATFDGAEVPEIELTRVEVWDGDTVPPTAVLLVQPQSAESTRYSQAGWVLWGGRLELPNRVVDFIDPDKHIIRVWGYSPYVKLVDDTDVVPVSAELEELVRYYCRVQALEALVGSRALFKQWQTRTNNSDVSFAGLMSDLNVALENWRRKSRAAFVLREAP